MGTLANFNSWDMFAGKTVEVVSKPIYLNHGITSAMLWLGGFVVVPWAEELVFRVLLFYVLLRPVGKWPAVLISSALFSLGHQNQWTEFGWPVGFMLFFFGLLASFIYLRTGRLQWPVIFHAIWCMHHGLFLFAIPSLKAIV